MSEKVNVRGVFFDSFTMEETVDCLCDRLDKKLPTAVYTPNAEIVQACVEDKCLYAVINSAEVVIPDGIGVIKAARICKTPLKEKVAGVTVGERLIERVSKMPAYSIYFLGGKPGIAESAAEKMREKYPGVRIVGCHDGYFKKTGAENDAVVAAINQSGAAIIYVFLGAPTQEKWIYDNRDKLNATMYLGLGGSVDIYAGCAKRAPEIFIKLGLEWFYRLCREPWRIGRMMKLPKFYFGTWIYHIRNRRNSKRG